MSRLAQEPLADLARFQGVPALARIRAEFLPLVDNPAWRGLIEDLLVLEEPLTAYGHPRFEPCAFEACPGSGAHHAHVGGLAAHVLQDLVNAEALARGHLRRGLPLDRGLLHAAILLHDVMKRFVYRFTPASVLEKSEDPFIGRREDHHSWVLRELAVRGADRELVLAVAAMHGIDDVSVDGGVKPFGVVNHYLAIGHTGLTMTDADVRPEHVFGFLADSDWPFSGRAQARCRSLAEGLAQASGLDPGYAFVYLGSRFGFEHVAALLDTHDEAGALEHLLASP